MVVLFSVTFFYWTDPETAGKAVIRQDVHQQLNCRIASAAPLITDLRVRLLARRLAVITGCDVFF
jgi:hypothetical protein